jgi:hypothetical protein
VTSYSIGYGDITPINIYEKLWVTLFMIVGSMLFSYTISTLSLIFSENETFFKVEFKKKSRALESGKNCCHKGFGNPFFQSRKGFCCAL